MFTCSNCGASVREGAKFCTACGTRLNDTHSASSDSTWSSSSSPETTLSSDVEPTTPAASQSEDAGVSVPGTIDMPVDDNASSAPSIEVTGATSPDAPDMPVDDNAVASEGFTWSWGKAEETDGDAQSDELGLIEVESGMVIEEHESNADHASGTIVDASEIDVLEVEPAMSIADENTESQAQTDGEISEIVEVEVETVTVTEDIDDSETLAAWAEQWNEPADVDTSVSATTDSSGDEETPDVAQQVDGDDEEEEDTVAKAERLIGELRAVIPALVRPRPVAPVVSADSSALADQLASAAQSENFDDLREALETMRDNPRDIDSMLKLSGQAERLLALLDDRNNLAKSAEDAASQLRGTITPELM